MFDIFLGKASPHVLRSPVLSKVEKEKLTKLEAMRKCEEEIMKIFKEDENLIHTCRLRCQRRQDKVIERVVCCLTNRAFYVLRYDYKAEEIVNSYEYPLECLTSVIREKYFTTSKSLFLIPQVLDSLKMVNKFIEENGKKEREKAKKRSELFGKYYPTKVTQIDEEGLFAAIDKTETTFTDDINKKDKAFVWPTLFANKKEKFDELLSKLEQVKPDLMVFSYILDTKK